MLREGWHRRILIDLLMWVIAALLCMLWRWVTDKSEIAVYWSLFGLLAVMWVIIGFAVQLYRSYRIVRLWQSVLSVIADAAILIALCWWWLPQMPYNLSPKVAMCHSYESPMWFIMKGPALKSADSPSLAA